MTNTEKISFIARYTPEVIAATLGTRIFPSVKMAQLILETGWGSTIKKSGNNLFGIKASANWPGKVISFTTQEVINGTRQTFQGTGKIYNTFAEAKAAGANTVTLFRAYDTPADSIRDHSRFLISLARYKAVLNAATPEEQAQQLQIAGYATAANYANNLISIINTNKLSNLDVKKKSLP